MCACFSSMSWVQKLWHFQPSYHAYTYIHLCNKINFPSFSTFGDSLILMLLPTWPKQNGFPFPFSLTRPFHAIIISISEGWAWYVSSCKCSCSSYFHSANSCYCLEKFLISSLQILISASKSLRWASKSTTLPKELPLLSSCHFSLVMFSLFLPLNLLMCYHTDSAISPLIE